MTSSVEQLAQTAGRLANEGRWPEAEEVWKEVHRLDPGNPKALYGLGVHALQRGDLGPAIAHLNAAVRAAPNDPLAWQTLSVASGRAGDAAGELQAIEQALAVDAYYLPALLAKAGWIERHGKPAIAAIAFANALKVAPPESHWPDFLRPQLQHARSVVRTNSERYSTFLAQRLARVEAGLTATEAERWRESASIMAGLSRPYHADCNQLHVPRLPAIPFYDRAQFGWAKALEDKTDLIRGELFNALKTQQGDFQPYIAYRPGDPVNQWKELNHSTRWSTYHLWRGGAPVDEHLQRCPETAKALEAVDMAEIGGLCPNAMFSALAPHTHIPPHHGETNARLVVHLPLIVPDGCTYRVGFERRQWKVGELLIFDDTLEHEARNDSDELRVVLIFDIWNPLLSVNERSVVQAMTAAARDYAARD
jgi:aspartate beta-hydroxylase